VGPLRVELLPEGVEARLLLQAVQAGRAGGLLLEREMHALVTAILLWMAGLDALDRNAQAQPPNRELGEVEQGVGAGKRDAIVGANSRGQAALLEELLEGGDGQVLAGGLQGFAQEQEARGVVGDG
jgi:hypothetical protein